MTDPLEHNEFLGSALARARLKGAVVDLPLCHISDLAQAEAVQARAVEDYGGSQVGYAVQGTSLLTQKRLGCQGPFFGPLFEDDVRPDAARIHLPDGVMGVGCTLAFTLGRPFPLDDEEIGRSSASEAIILCRPLIQVLGRRVPGSAPLNALTATADFALDVASIIGIPALVSFEHLDLTAMQVAALIDGNIVSRGCAADILGHPLEAVAWLAGELRGRGRRLEAGDLVAIGSCVGVLQVIPGQTIQADFLDIGTVEASFD